MADAPNNPQRQDIWADDPSMKGGATPAGVPPTSGSDDWKVFQQGGDAPEQSYGDYIKSISTPQSALDFGKGIVKSGISSINNMGKYSLLSAFADPDSKTIPVNTDPSNMPQKVGRAMGDAAQMVLPAAAGIGEAAPAIRAAAIGDTDAAALRGLRVGAGSSKALPTIKAVQGARPYLQGAQSLEDLQSRIGPAKNEIWSPYKQAIDSMSGQQVQGPDGMTTIGDLESERLKVSAQLRALKNRDPEAVQTALQKGQGQAQLDSREKALKAALDPHLSANGIDPGAIRGNFQNIARIGSKVEGKSTLNEAPAPYGFGKIANISIKHPLKAPAEIASGVRDLAAGRPLWSGSPTDIGIREAFASGGPKPNLGSYRPPTIRGLLPAPLREIPLSDPLERGSTRGGVFDAEKNTSPVPGQYDASPRSSYMGGVEGWNGPQVIEDPGFVSGGAHPELSGRYGPAKGVIRTREGGGLPELDEFGRIKINRIGQR